VAHAAQDEDFAGVAVFQAKHASCGARKVSLPRRSAHLVRKDTQFSCPWRLRGVEGGRASGPCKSSSRYVDPCARGHLATTPFHRSWARRSLPVEPALAANSLCRRPQKV
jgi:hypothetical protein